MNIPARTTVAKSHCIDSQNLPNARQIAERMRQRWRGLGYNDEQIEDKADDLARELRHYIGATALIAKSTHAIKHEARRKPC